MSCGHCGIVFLGTAKSAALINIGPWSLDDSGYHFLMHSWRMCYTCAPHIPCDGQLLTMGGQSSPTVTFVCVNPGSYDDTFLSLHGAHSAGTHTS